MLVVETIAKIRRLSLVHGKSIKEIRRELRISRKVVRKVLRSDATEFRYERERQPMPKIGPWQGQLDGFLNGNHSKVGRERLTLIRIFEELRGLGNDGSYDAVRRYAKSWAKAQGSRDGGSLCAVVLPAGRGLPVRLEPRDRPDQWRDCDREGRPCPALPQPHDIREGLSARDAGDGVRRARPRFCLLRWCLHARHLRQHEDGGGNGVRRQDRQYNRRFLQMCSHYLVQPVACTPASGWEKGQVENQVGLVRGRFFTLRLRFKSYEELNAWLLDKCIAYTKAHRHIDQPERTISNVFEEERGKLASIVGPSMDSTRSPPRCRRPARCASATTNTRCSRRPSAAQKAFCFVPILVCSLKAITPKLHAYSGWTLSQEMRESASQNNRRTSWYAFCNATLR
jgi:hypothetical protein